MVAGGDMRLRSGLDRFATAVLVVSLGVVVSGTKACQTDYEIGAQAKAPNGTITPSSTSGEDGTAQPTGSVTVTPTGTLEGDGSETATPTAIADVTGTEMAVVGEEDLFNELSKLGGSAESSGKGGAVAGAVAGVMAGVVKSENWLGDAFSKDEDGSWHDSDGDGFSDALEEQHGTDPNSASSAPRTALVTRLATRVGGDALSDEPLSEPDAATDTDLDGVSDELEEKRGMNPRSVDSDNDGLSDNRELAFGSNPLQIDSDNDGIADGREYEFGADPTLPEPSR
jgi:hypothetical protein